MIQYTAFIDDYIQTPHNSAQLRTSPHIVGWCYAYKIESFFPLWTGTASTTSNINMATIEEKKPLTFKSLKTEKVVGYQRLGCWYSAPYNQKAGYGDLDLKLKVGSCYTIRDTPAGKKAMGWGHLTIGERIGCAPQNLSDWKGILDVSHSDVHCWLEDKAGRVYDYNFWDDKPIEGMDAKKLKKNGIVYKAAEGAAEALIYETSMIKIKRDAMYAFAEEGVCYEDSMNHLNKAKNTGVNVLEKVITRRMSKEGFGGMPLEAARAWMDGLWKEYSLPAESKPTINEVTTKVYFTPEEEEESKEQQVEM